MERRLSSLDEGYVNGQLSVFPEALDDFESLYRATNNAIVPLKHSMSFNAHRIIVENTDLFPINGLLRIGPELGTAGQYELVYYGKKTINTFENIMRGFAGSKQSPWLSNESFVSNSVFAEHHNAIKDALINMQINCGIKDLPRSESLNGILKSQEIRFLTPKPLFRSFPKKGPSALKVRFQNFSTGHIIRYLWDFGDGGSSLEKSPIHTYLNEGVYTVKLNVITSTGGQGVATKSDYITVDDDESTPFFYVESINNPYSQETAPSPDQVKNFIFVDQSDGDIVQRNWIFGDGKKFTQQDPDIHEISHEYEEPGEYIVSQIIQFSNGKLKRVELPDPLTVI